MAKPILILSLYIDGENGSFISKKLQNIITDWHIIVISTPNSKNEFYAFSDQNATEIDISELKESLEQIIKQDGTA